jgi:GNAT superfamily N-acetyltransferase
MPTKKRAAQLDREIAEALADQHAAPQSIAEVRDQWRALGVEKEYVAQRENGEILLSQIVVPKELRGQGIGAKAMKLLTDYADQGGHRILLSPSTSFGGSSVARLKKFYKRFGFVENKGRHRVWDTTESMYRLPRS